MSIIEIVDEPAYAFGSIRQAGSYPFELNLSDNHHPSSVHGLRIDGMPIAVFGACGGATNIHSNSMIAVGGRSYLAIGPFIVCFSTFPFKCHWALQAEATCFGVYHQPACDALLSHGELAISRFDQTGHLIWSSSGADILTGKLTLHPAYVWKSSTSMATHTASIARTVTSTYSDSPHSAQFIAALRRH